jgi:hypothetical protein
MRPVEFLIFMRRYFPVFIGGIFAAIFSFATTLVLYFDAFCQSAALNRCLMVGFAVMIVATTLMCICHIFLIRGRPIWVWAVAMLLLACLLLVLPISAQRPGKVMYLAAVAFPLIGLVILNSERHRAMRKILLVIRHKRSRLQGIHKARLRRLKAEQRK